MNNPKPQMDIMSPGWTPSAAVTAAGAPGARWARLVGTKVHRDVCGHRAHAFGLSSKTAIGYSGIACTLIERQIEQTVPISP